MAQTIQCKQIEASAFAYTDRYADVRLLLRQQTKRSNRLARSSLYDSLLEEAVTSEPVSGSAKFPASREDTGNFAGSGLNGR